MQSARELRLSDAERPPRNSVCLLRVLCREQVNRRVKRAPRKSLPSVKKRTRTSPRIANLSRLAPCINALCTVNNVESQKRDRDYARSRAEEKSGERARCAKHGTKIRGKLKARKNEILHPLQIFISQSRAFPRVAPAPPPPSSKHIAMPRTDISAQRIWKRGGGK